MISNLSTTVFSGLVLWLITAMLGPFVERIFVKQRLRKRMEILKLLMELNSLSEKSSKYSFELELIQKEAEIEFYRNKNTDLENIEISPVFGRRDIFFSILSPVIIAIALIIFSSFIVVGDFRMTRIAILPTAIIPIIFSFWICKNVIPRFPSLKERRSFRYFIEILIGGLIGILLNFAILLLTGFIIVAYT